MQRAHAAIEKGKFKEAARLADDAGVIWSANAAGHDADYADALVLEAFALLAPQMKHGFPGRDSEEVAHWESLSAEILERAVKIPGASARVRAMALDLECLQPRNAGRLDSLLREASEMHSKAVKEILPGTQEMSAQPGRTVKAVEVEAATLIHKTEPAYAPLAKALKVTGVVLLSFVVEVDGTASSATVTKLLGWGLDEEAAKALKQWRFHPATRDRKPVRAQANVQMSFNPTFALHPKNHEKRGIAGSQPLCHQ